MLYVKIKFFYKHIHAPFLDKFFVERFELIQGKIWCLSKAIKVLEIRTTMQKV